MADLSGIGHRQLFKRRRGIKPLCGPLLTLPVAQHVPVQAQMGIDNQIIRQSQK
jgi:hypothetical protein